MGLQIQIGKDLYTIHINKKSRTAMHFGFYKWRGQDSNLRPSGYEPDELPAAPPRDVELQIYNLMCSKVNPFL